MKTVVVTGGFDPLHSGHIAYFRAAAALGDWLVVGVNSDQWLTRKKGQPFMPVEERIAVIDSIGVVNQVITFNDFDNTACDAIEKVLLMYQGSEIVFANGGDRTNTSTPEYEKYKDHSRVEFAWGVGGENKANSSSWILDNWKAPKTERPWGYYKVIHQEDRETKVKELVVNPKQKLSLQRHQYRSEHWIVTSGTATVWQGWDKMYLTKKYLAKHQEIDIPVGCWHQLCNETDQPLKIVEIQHGISCIEEDIERHQLELRKI